MKNYLVVSLFKNKCPNYTLRHYWEEICIKLCIYKEQVDSEFTGSNRGLS